MPVRHGGRHHALDSTITQLVIDDETRRRVVGTLDGFNGCLMVIGHPLMAYPEALAVCLQDRISSPRSGARGLLTGPGLTTVT